MKALSNSFLQSTKLHLLILGICWVAMQLFLLCHFGVVTGFEAAKYIDEAKRLLNGESVSTANFYFYSTEIWLIALCLKLKVEFGFVVLVQMLFNAASIYLFYTITEKISGRKIIAFFACLYFLAMFFYQLYNVHLFTESLFFSFSIIYAFVLFRFKKLNVPNLLLIIAMLALMAVTRPTGLLFIPATILFLIFRFANKKTWFYSMAALTAGLVVFYILLNKALDAGGEWDFLLPYVQEHVICGVPTVQQPHQIEMPVNQNSVEGLWHVIVNNRELFIKLAWKRLIAFWTVQRSYYSTGHNTFVALYFYLFYLLVLLGIRKLLRYHRSAAVFIFTYVFLVMLTVMLTCDEWHNRFMYAILPLLLMAATAAFSREKI